MKKNTGFTLIEILLVITIISAVSVILLSVNVNLLRIINKTSTQIEAEEFINQTLLLITQEARWAKEINPDTETSNHLLKFVSENDEEITYQYDSSLQTLSRQSQGIDQTLNPPKLKITQFDIENISTQPTLKPSYQIYMTVEYENVQNPNQPHTYTNTTAITIRNKFPGIIE